VTEGRGDNAVRGTAGGAFINMPVMGEEARGRPFDEGEMKGVGRRFGSTPTGCGRAMDGGAWSGGSVGGGR
jgi:hypothetical protein